GLCQANQDAHHGLAQAREAAALLASTSAGFEVAAARAIEAWALAHLGRWESSQEVMNDILIGQHSLSRAETLIEAADLQNWYGDSRVALVNLEEARAFLERYPGLLTQWRLTWAQTMVREGRFDEAQSALSQIEPMQWATEVGFKSRLDATRAGVAVHLPGAPSSEALEQANNQACHQRARLWFRYVSIVGAMRGHVPEMYEIVSRGCSDGSEVI